MKKRPRLLQILLVVVLSFLSSGCWDRVEVNDIAIVLSTAFDLEDDGQYRVTVQMALPGQMGGPSGGGGGGTSGSKSYYVDSDVGRTMREANARLQRRLSRRLFFPHRRVLIFGEGMAKQGIRETFDVVARVPENRLSTQVIIAKGKGYALLNARPQFERNSSEAMREIVSSDSVMSADLRDVATDMSEEGTDAVIPYMGVVQSQASKDTKQEVQFLGYAQFRDEKMVGTLDAEAEEGLRWLRMQFKPYEKTLNVAGGSISITIHKGQVSIKPVLLQDHVRFDVKVDATGYALEATSGIDLGKTEAVAALRKALADAIHRSVLAAGEKIKTQSADSASLGLLLSRREPRLWAENYRQRWYDGELKNVDFTVDVETRISRIGLITENIAKREHRIDE